MNINEFVLGIVSCRLIRTRYCCEYVIATKMPNPEDASENVVCGGDKRDDPVGIQYMGVK